MSDLLAWLQFMVPVALILWVALWPLRGRARLVHLAMTTMVVAVVALSGAWLWPSAYAPYGLGVLLIVVAGFGRRRPVARGQARLWPAVFGVLVTGLASIVVAGLVTARMRPPETLALALPFASPAAITEGGARSIINRHRAVARTDSPSLSGWGGMARAVTLRPVDHLGRPFAKARPVLAPCAGQVTGQGNDPRLGTYLMLDCAGRVIVMSDLVTSTPGAGPITAGQIIGTAASLTLHAQSPGTAAHPFSGTPQWLALNGRFPVRGAVLFP
jgi:hypothetical protein